MFFSGSRYLDVPSYKVELSTRSPGTRRAEVRQIEVKQTRPLKPTTTALVYEVKQGDRLDLLSFRFFRTSRRGWLICDANPEYLHPEDLLVPGNRIIIPRDQ